MNLIITCPRHFEEDAQNEIEKILDEFGDEEPEIFITNLQGILTVKTNLKPLEIIQKIREKILDEPWSVRYCLRIIPIEGYCDTDLEKIEDEVLKLVGKIKTEDTFRITIEKRNSKLSTNEIISNIANKISNKVSLDDPNWIVLIEIIGNQTGVAIIPNDAILSVERTKRSLTE